MDARSRESCEATLARADGVVWSRNFFTTPPRPLHQRRLRCFFLMSRPPLLLLRRGAPMRVTSAIRASLRRMQIPEVHRWAALLSDRCELFPTVW